MPGLSQPGGFTLTSAAHEPTLELAVQRAPGNPPAAWLWRPAEEIVGSRLRVRVGGSFVWPPPGGAQSVSRAVFVAGGVGIK